jgi:predicted dehydrogenase
MGDRLRVGIVGLGIGGAHADGFRRLPDQFDVVVAADLDPQRVAFVTEWLGCEGATSFAEVVDRTDLDAISLATPPALHFDQVAAVLASGKTAICEKPLVGSLGEVDRLAEIERETGRRVMPIYQYRWGRGLQKLKHLVDRGVAGRCNVTSIDVAWRRRPEYYDVPWRGRLDTELGGVLLSHALHALDMLTYVVGPARRVFARTCVRVNDIETEDCASVSLEMADGSFATLSATLGSSAEISRHRFCFEHLAAESNTEPYENHREPWTLTPDTPEAAVAIAEALDHFVPGPELYKGQFARLHVALEHGGELPVTLADARASLELVTALYWSARTGEQVELPIGPDHPAYGGWR